MQMKHMSVCVYTCVRPVCSISVELPIMHRVLIYFKVLLLFAIAQNCLFYVICRVPAVMRWCQ